ncbi:hypothetical protein HO414_11760 [Streptococcus suis]|nr:hypothetical protein [Streptococcus suis]
MDLENISNLIQDQLIQGWVRRAILLLLVMVLICLVEIILFYFLTGKLFKAFKLMDGKINKLILWGYRLSFWGSIGLIVFSLVTSLSTGLDLWNNVQALQELDVQAIGMDIQAIVAEAPLTKIGDIRSCLTAFKTIFAIRASFWQPRNHWSFRSQNSTHSSVSGQLPTLSYLPYSAISTLILNKNQKQTSQVFLNHCLLTIGFKIDQSNSRITS